MFLHLGQSVVVNDREVIGIFDLDNTTQSHLTRAYLERAQANGRVVSVNDDIPKSFIVCEDSYHDIWVYISQISTSTLLKRWENEQVVPGNVWRGTHEQRTE